MINQVLKERYLIQKQLSQNAGRRTFLAQDLETKQLVVIKILIFGADFQWEDLKLFEREAQTLQTLSHPAIPCYLDYFDIDTAKVKGFALVQSYIPAKSLEQWLKNGRSFSESEVIQLAKSLLEILRYLHWQQPQVIHRDIKPSNILLENRSGNSIGQVYLVDLGSVQTLAARKGGTITVVGTYGYMPPEQFGGRAVPASDLYSLGATLIYVVTGRHPAALSQDNLRIQFESAVNLNPGLIDWLKQMTEPSLNRRLASVEAALKALEHPREKTGIVVTKPNIFGSRIQVKQNQETEEILIPPARLSLETAIKIFRSKMWSTVLTSIVFLFTAGFVIYWGIVTYQANTGLSWSPITHSLPRLIVGLFTGAVGLLLLFIYQSGIPALFFRQIRVKINQQQISFISEWPWGKYSHSMILKDITELVYHPGYLQTDRGKKGKKSTRLILPQVIICTGKKEYKFSINHLSDPEIEWIKYRLNRWLKKN